MLTTCQRCRNDFAPDDDDQFLCDDCTGDALDRFRATAREYREANARRMADHERRLAQLEQLLGMDRLPSSIDEAMIVAVDNPCPGARHVPVDDGGMRGRPEIETTRSES